METLILVAGVIMLAGAVAFAFRSSTSEVAFAFIGMNAVAKSGYVEIPTEEVLFWAIATLLVLFANFSRLYRGRFPNVWRNYIVGGSIVGMAAGCTVGHAGIIAGAALGAFLGGVAFTRTVAGTPFRPRMWRALCEIGLPAVVSMSMVGLALLGLVQR